MNMHYFFLTLLVATHGVGLHAQGYNDQDQVRSRPIKITFYYTLDWELTKPEKSFYKREAFFDCTDMVFDGVFKDYNKGNILIADGSYAHGVKGGFQNEYFANRSLKSTIEYDGIDFTIWERKDEQKQDSIKNGTGRFTLSYFYLTGLVSAPTWKQGVLNGEFLSGKRVGTWTYQDLNKNKTDLETYENGKLTKRIHFSELAAIELNYSKDIILSLYSILTETLAFDHSSFAYLNEVFEQQPIYPASFQRGVSYPGGMKRLLLLLAQNTEVPPGQLCIVKLRVDEHGKILKYSIAESTDPELYDYALKAFKLYEDKFMPALKNGVPYASSIYLPISSGQNWIDYLNATRIEDILLMR